MDIVSFLGSIALLVLYSWDERHDTRLELAHFSRHRSSTGTKKQYSDTPGQTPKGSPRQGGRARQKEVAEHHKGIDKSNPVAAALGKASPPMSCPIAPLTYALPLSALTLPCPALPCPALPCPAACSNYILM